MENLKQIIYNLEIELLKPEVRSSAERLDALLDDDFIEYGSSGLIYDKAMILERLPQGPSPLYTIYDFEVISLSETVVQARFKTDRINLDNTKTISLRTSLWKQTGNTWQMFFHQGTPIK